MSRLRVLVVEDSATVRAHLCAVLRNDPTIAVVGEAGDGKEAISLCRQLRPDVITMDMMLPFMSGLAATEYVMAHLPTPILIVSSSTNRGELFKTFEALAAGAVDVMSKPTTQDTDTVWEQAFLAAVKRVARISVITHLRARRQAPPADPAPSDDVLDDVRRSWAATSPPAVVAVGASTGGPAALVEVLRGMPTSFSPPVLVVLHLGAPFGAGFADWLDGQTAWSVRYARDNEVLGVGGGLVLMAPPDRHLIVRNHRLHLTDDPERYSCRPSVDVLFESVALEYGPRAAGCLLTGMGRDGAAGLAAIRRLGGSTIAQDEATSVVFGMPREAEALGAVQHLLPLSTIGPALATWDRCRHAGADA